MPRQKPQPTGRFMALHEESLTHGEGKQDCVVKAFAMAKRIPYKVALETAGRYGREPGRPMKQSQWRKMFKDEGVVLKSIDPGFFIDQYRTYPKVGRVPKNVTSHHPDRFPGIWANGKEYILLTSCHMIYVEDGVSHDWSRGRLLQVIEIYEVQR